jgi:hypothetical protein
MAAKKKSSKSPLDQIKGDVSKGMTPQEAWNKAVESGAIRPTNEKPVEAISKPGEAKPTGGTMKTLNLPKPKARLTVLDERPSIFSPSQVLRALSNATRGMQGSSKIEPMRTGDVAALAAGVVAGKAIPVARALGSRAASAITSESVAARGPQIASKVIKNPVGKVVEVTKGGITGQMNNVGRVAANVVKNPANVAAGQRGAAIGRAVSRGVAARNVAGGAATYLAGKSAGAAQAENKKKSGTKKK